MKRTRHTPEQIVRKLREADKLLAEGMPIGEVVRHLGVSHQTYQRWRTQFGNVRPDDMVRLKELEKENARLKRLLAEKDLENDMLREVAKGTVTFRTRGERRSAISLMCSGFRSVRPAESWDSTVPPSATAARNVPTPNW